MREVIAQGREAVAAYITAKGEETFAAAQPLVMYVTGIELIRSLTYGDVSAVQVEDVRVVLDGIDMAFDAR